MSTEQFASMTDVDADKFMPISEIQPVRALLARMVGHGTVIDIGCGKGDEVSDLFDSSKYLGVDCSPALIRIARHRNPGFRFSATEARKVNGFWDYAIIKSVLEHIPQDEALAVYEHARTICGILLVAWHTEPGKENLAWYDGEIGRMQQNRHDRSKFSGVEHREVCGKHVVWQVI
jgi:SAM-dependent methyltransferase